jgi:hypothetical protein
MDTPGTALPGTILAVSTSSGFCGCGNLVLTKLPSRITYDILLILIVWFADGLNNEIAKRAAMMASLTDIS